MEEGQIVTSRQQRVMEAKAAFSGGEGERERQRGLSPHRNLAQSAAMTSGNLSEEEYSFYEKWRIRRCFALLRFMMAAAIVLLLMAAFSRDFSYHGFDQSYVQKQMEDETTWNALEEKVQNLYRELITTE